MATTPPTTEDTVTDPYQAAWDEYIRVTVRSHRIYKRSPQERGDLNAHQQRTERAYAKYVKTTKSLDADKMKQEVNRV